MIRTKFSSAGPVFYKQERLGFKGKPFTMYTLRSMYVNAEDNGPQLSSENDERITAWGRVMRKWRLDELPQLWNIIKGEMSLVGPRPERKFYVDQVVALHPEYKYLFKVKPGITSWGMVKFGYASSIDEIVLRMPFDLLYFTFARFYHPASLRKNNCIRKRKINRTILQQILFAIFEKIISIEKLTARYCTSFIK